MIVSSLWVCTFGSTLHWCNIRPTLCFYRGWKKYDIINILWSFSLFVSKPKKVVCPHCYESVVAKGMREHIALTCTMAPLEIRKEMKGRIREDEKSPNMSVIFGGAVLLFFGLPFTLTPFFIYQLWESMFNSDGTFILLLILISFAIVILMFGLFIQITGLAMMRGNVPNWAKHSGRVDNDQNFWDRHDHP